MAGSTIGHLLRLRPARQGDKEGECRSADTQEISHKLINLSLNQQGQSGNRLHTRAARYGRG